MEMKAYCRYPTTHIHTRALAQIVSNHSSCDTGKQVNDLGACKATELHLRLSYDEELLYRFKVSV